MLEPVQYDSNMASSAEGLAVQWRCILRCQLQPTVSTKGHAVGFNEDEGALNLSYMHIHYKGLEQFTSHSVLGC
jgi:hypothetical protein